MKRRYLCISVFIMALALSFYIHVPYYMMTPGSTIPLGSKVQVENGDRQEKGSFRMTTVRMGQASVVGFLYSLLDPYVDTVDSDKIYGPGGTEEQFRSQEKNQMIESHNNAKIIAFRKAGYDHIRKASITLPIDIGGPSAGLMFTLEMIQQMTKGDLTKGYQIAGTGTINENGMVGRIGGIQHKVVAVYRDGVDIFFTPPTNYQQAILTAKHLNAPIKIVQIRNIEDALEYLSQLPPRG